MRQQAVHARPRFARDTRFQDEVRRRVLGYFEHAGLSQRDNLRMYVKTAVLLLWFGASYALLVLVPRDRVDELEVDGHLKILSEHDVHLRRLPFWWLVLVVLPYLIISPLLLPALLEHIRQVH